MKERELWFKRLKIGDDFFWSSIHSVDDYIISYVHDIPAPDVRLLNARQLYLVYTAKSQQKPTFNIWTEKPVPSRVSGHCRLSCFQVLCLMSFVFMTVIIIINKYRCAYLQSCECNPRYPDHFMNVTFIFGFTISYESIVITCSLILDWTWPQRIFLRKIVILQSFSHTGTCESACNIAVNEQVRKFFCLRDEEPSRTVSVLVV